MYSSRLLGAALFAVSGAAFALPELQLTIPNGTYNGPTETTVASGQTFNVYALFDPKQDNPATQFYITAALELGTGDSPVTTTVANRGSFTFAGNTVNVTADMTQGAPDGLPTHGDFNTWYYQLPFTFSASDSTTAFDAAPSPPATIVGGCVTNCVYFASFAVDTTLLNSLYSIHFDVFDQGTLDGLASAVNAPFSHDAQSSTGGCRGGTDCVTVTQQDTPVPEPASLALLGAGLAALGSMRKLRKSR